MQAESECLANRPYDRNTFNIPKNVQRRNKLRHKSKIQDTDTLVSLLSGTVVRDLLHLLTVKKFLLHSASATEFLCERKSSIF